MVADDPRRPKTWPRRLRSAEWFDAPGREGILHRSWVRELRLLVGNSGAKVHRGNH
jgi:hypothetical protein